MQFNLEETKLEIFEMLALLKSGTASMRKGELIWRIVEMMQDGGVNWLSN